MDLSPDQLSIVRELFLKHGYRGTSIRTVAQALELAPNEIYRMFGGKKPLFDLVLAHELEFIQQFLASVRAQTSDSREQLKAWFKELRGFLRRGGEIRGLLIINLACELASADDDIRGAVARAHDALIKEIGEMVRQFRRSPDGPKDREIAEYIFAALTGSVVLAVVDQDDWEFENGMRRLQEYIDQL